MKQCSTPCTIHRIAVTLSAANSNHCLIALTFTKSLTKLGSNPLHFCFHIHLVLLQLLSQYLLCLLYSHSIPWFVVPDLYIPKCMRCQYKSCHCAWDKIALYLVPYSLLFHQFFPFNLLRIV
eukprot:568157_1